MQNDWFTFDRQTPKITIRFSDKKDLVIGKDDVQLSYFSGGPGGQNVNRHLKGVQLIYQIPDAYRLLNQKTRQIVTRVIGKRSIHHNIEAAFEQLAYKLEHYFYIPPFRKKTKTPKRAKEKRLKNKRHQSLKKQSRQVTDY